MVRGIEALSDLPQEAMQEIFESIYPSLRGSGGLVSGSAGAGSVVNNTNNYSVQVNPTYSQVQTPTSIYYDVTAALASTRI
jgi:hypothetical protein